MAAAAAVPAPMLLADSNAADADIFQVIEKAIAVAAADSPDELRARRARIAEALYVCLACICSTHRLHNHHHNQEEADQKEEEQEEDCRVGSNLSYDEAEALTEKIEEESHTLGEVLRIKGILSTGREQSYGVLFESLRRLQLMELSVQTLQNVRLERWEGIGDSTSCSRGIGMSTTARTTRCAAMRRGGTEGTAQATLSSALSDSAKP
ncbi:putative mediator of RNA polymerase II transcription subunit 26b [Ananas comosus]|uniref:Putative mediator of RNA polymerase II transcription subunit 26b n=1 Tax=Ananas comosus TaxID=4615 RepID=A0A199VDQ6_ANACO|nr:putative mediator of RNA polymerase II transcription subunit 26b [Ananas comosus]